MTECQLEQYCCSNSGYGVPRVPEASFSRVRSGRVLLMRNHCSAFCEWCGPWNVEAQRQLTERGGSWNIAEIKAHSGSWLLCG